MDDRVQRLAFFSDAVFAIAITLLVIEIHVPKLSETGEAASKTLIHLIPSFFGFVLSFLVIGRFWIGHHAAFARVTTWSDSLMWSNLFLLMAVAFMPFATAFMSANLGMTVPMIFYSSILLVVALLSWNLVRVATNAWRDEDAPERGLMLARSRSVIVAAAITLALAFVTPTFNFLAMGTAPLWARVFGRKAVAQ